MPPVTNAIRNALGAYRTLGASATAKLHLAKALPTTDRKQAVHVNLPGVPGGIWIRARGSDMQVALQTFETRDYALGWCPPYLAHIQALCRQTLDAGQVPLIIDVGANFGASTLLFASAFPNCHIYAIEPDPENFGMLQRNAEGRGNITLFRAALWDKPANLGLLHPDSTGWACRVQEVSAQAYACLYNSLAEVGSRAAFTGSSVPSLTPAAANATHSISIVTAAPGGMLPSVTIPDLLARDRRMRPIIVKIDIEGAETTALRSNNTWADDVPLMIYEQHDPLYHWLGLWQGSGHAFEAVLTRKMRERLRRGENDYAFLHPHEMQAAAQSGLLVQMAD